MKNKPLAAGVLVCAILLAQAAFGASTWEGSAVVTSTTDFPGEGLFGACNSFPLNSTVEVENLETGRKTSVLITKNVDNPAIFMALSPKAALELGMKAGSSARIRVLAPSGAASTPAPTTASASAESLDPDYNPRLLASIRPVPTAPAGSESSRDFMSLLGAGYPGNAAEDSKPEPASVPAATPSSSPTAEVPPTPASILGSTPVEAPPKPETPPAETPPETVPAKAVLPIFPENTVQSLTPPKNAAPDAGLASPAVLAPESSGTAALSPPAPSRLPANLASPGLINPEASSPGALPPPASRSLPGSELALPALASDKALDTSPPQVSEPRSLPVAEAPAVLPALPEALAAAPAPTAAETPQVAEATPVAETPKVESPLVPEEPSLEAVLDLSPPSPVETEVEIALADPEAPPEAGAVAVLPPSLSDASAKAPGATLESLSLPEPALGPDILPEAVLERLANPPKSSPSLALADSEVIMPPTDKPEALAMEGSKPGAGDKLVALVPTEPRPPEKPEALGPQASPVKAPDQPPPSLATPSGPETKPAVAVAPAPATTPPIAAAPPPSAATPSAVAPATPPLASLTPAPAKAPPAKAPPAASTPATVAAAPAKAPPAATVAPAPKAPPGAPAKEPSDLVRLDGMKAGSWYVQIGLFGTEDALRQAIKAAARQFPVLYETVVDSKGQVRYRLYVGPLGRDEGGLILTRIKGLGYKDAVLRKG